MAAKGQMKTEKKRQKTKTNKDKKFAILQNIQGV